jgi:hypothetical protein
MAEHLIETINRISTPPADGVAFDEWLEATDGIDLLKENIQGDEFLFYATPGGTFIHSVLVPAANVNPPDIEDLTRWSFNAYGTWGVSYSLTDSPRVWLDAPFKHSGTKSFERGSIQNE